jgi:hypothetical protein
MPGAEDEHVLTPGGSDEEQDEEQDDGLEAALSGLSIVPAVVQQSTQQLGAFQSPPPTSATQLSPFATGGPPASFFQSNEDEEEHEGEGEYTAYGASTKTITSYTVAGGGLMNGNAYATVEDDGEGKVYYCEYGKSPSRELIGTHIVFRTGDTFDVEA